MQNALYYPHTEIVSKNLLFRSLLLWDEIQFITPGIKYEPYYQDREMSEAIEVVGRGLPPTDDEKESVHTVIEKFVNSKLPSWFYFIDEYDRANRHKYQIYPQKLLPKTWKLLRDAGLASEDFDEQGDVLLRPDAGLAVMSLLAETCAGNTRARVTDRGAAYASILGYVTDAMKESNDDEEATAKKIVSEYRDKLVNISLETIDTRMVTFSQLVKFRKREKTERDGYQLRELRINLVDTINKYLLKIATQEANRSDAEEIVRQYKKDMERNWKKLMDELETNDLDFLLSKEIMLTCLVGGGTIAALSLGVPIGLESLSTAAGGSVTLGGGAVAAGSAVRAGLKYDSNRRSILHDNPMAYVYELKRAAP